MIRINLLGVERQAARKSGGAFLPKTMGEAAPLIGAVALIAAVAGIGWWHTSLQREATQLTAQLEVKRQEAARLKTVAAEVKRFEARRDQLQRRVSLIEELRKGQSVPVQFLDHVSRSLPDMLWLTALQQEAGAITIQGRSTTLIGLSDFVGNLASNGVLEKPVEIVNSEVTSVTSPGGGTASVATELVQFTVRARLTGTPAAADKP